MLSLTVSAPGSSAMQERLASMRREELKAVIEAASYVASGSTLPGATPLARQVLQWVGTQHPDLLPRSGGVRC